MFATFTKRNVDDWKHSLGDLGFLEILYSVQCRGLKRDLV